MRLVIVESPYGSPDPAIIERNVRYARACVADCIRRGEAPIASHLLLTQPGILRDEVPGERSRGIAAGHAWIGAADAMVIYLDLGVSAGMHLGIGGARALGIPMEERRLGDAELEQAIGVGAAAVARRTT